MSRNDKLTKVDFDKRLLAYELALDVENPQSPLSMFGELLIKQGWEISLVTLDEVSMPLIKDFYNSMNQINPGYIQARVLGVAFLLGLNTLPSVCMSKKVEMRLM